MNKNQIIDEINKLSLGLTERTSPKANAKIEATVNKIFGTMKKKGLQISKGSTNPSTSRSYDRIYLEKVGNTSHDYRHKAYDENVIEVWEFTTKSSGYFRTISARAVMKMCDELVVVVENA